MDFKKMMEQAQQFQEQMKQQQAELADLKITGEAAAGLVKITLNGRHDCEHIEIDENILTDLGSSDVATKAQAMTVLKDLIAASINDANQKIEAATQAKMQDMTKGLNIPGFPFGQS